jgi:DNA polymerase-3 subunit alpha
MFNRLEKVVASASSAQRDKAAGQGALFDTMDFAGAPAPETPKGAGESVPTAMEWPKEERLEHEKELLGFYVTGHPLDKFRGLIDSEKFSQLGLIDELDISNRRARFSFAGMIRSVEHRLTKTGKPFGILVVEDFTGSRELLCWAESYTPAREAGLMEAGQIIKFKAQIGIDDRTEQRRLTGSDFKALKLAQSKQNGKNATMELELRVARNNRHDLEQIRDVLSSHSGKTPVVLHVFNGAGKRATVEVAEEFWVEKTPAVETALDRWRTG